MSRPASAGLPHYRSASGWNALLPQRVVQRRGPDTWIDTAVVGAGFTGLAAARRLAELRPSEGVMVLDAGVVGEGASGRNAGVVVSVPHNLATGSSARDLFAAYEDGLGWLEGIVHGAGIDCDWHRADKLYAAATPGGEKAIGRLAETYRSWSVTVRSLDRDALEAATGTRYYRAGFSSGHTAFVQPAALVRGLADALPSNARVLERLPVLSVNGGGPFRLTTPEGEVTARRVILANNGLITRLGFLGGKLITIVTYAALTRRLPPDLLPALGGEDQWAVLPAHRLGSTLRRTADGRLLVRSAYSYARERPLPAVERMLRLVCARRFPALADAGFEHVWGGATALTRNGAAFFGEVAPGLYAAAGCNGSGILKGTLNGKLLAELALGHGSRALDTVRAQPGPSWLPPEPVRAAAVMAAIAYQRVRAGAER